MDIFEHFWYKNEIFFFFFLTEINFYRHISNAEHWWTIKYNTRTNGQLEYKCIDDYKKTTIANTKKKPKIIMTLRAVYEIIFFYFYR